MPDDIVSSELLSFFCWLHGTYVFQQSFSDTLFLLQKTTDYITLDVHLGKFYSLL